MNTLFDSIFAHYGGATPKSYPLIAQDTHQPDEVQLAYHNSLHTHGDRYQRRSAVGDPSVHQRPFTGRTAQGRFYETKDKAQMRVLPEYRPKVGRGIDTLGLLHIKSQYLEARRFRGEADQVTQYYRWIMEHWDDAVVIPPLVRSK